MGNEEMIKRFDGELRYFQGVRWGMKVCSRVSIGNECMIKGVDGE